LFRGEKRFEKTHARSASGQLFLYVLNNFRGDECKEHMRIFSSKISKSKSFSKISKSEIHQKFQGHKECTRGLKYLKEQRSEEIENIKVTKEGLRNF
jgi:hypothetical protein